jgi:hypothetical protein
MTPMEKVVARLKLAAETGFYSGLIETPGAAKYIDRCKGFDRRTGVLLIFTRDTGHHSSGWWKNPDYERCYHLSVSFRDPETLEPAPFDAKTGGQWAKRFFGANVRWLWIEPPYSEQGRALDVYHYRLFCDPGWQPIKPRGEVYSREFTEAGWKSFSDIHGDRAKEYEHSMGEAG